MATRATSPARKKTASRPSSQRPSARGVAEGDYGTGRSAGTRGAPARSSAARPGRAQDAIALLRTDHKLVTELFEKFEKMKQDSPQKKALVERICNELTVHTPIEEEIFYPAAREALKQKGEDLLDEAEVEHASAKELIAQLRGMNPGEHLYDAKVTVLSEYIKHHVKEEQNEMFPRVKKTSLDLKALGEQLVERKQELMSGMGQ